MILVWFSAALGACGDDALTNAAFQESLDGAWSMLLEGDDDAFRAEVYEAEKAIACLQAPVTVVDAARFHRNRALASSLSGDPKGALASAAASFRLAPEQAPLWAQENTAYSQLLDQAPDPGPVDEFATSLAARVYTDGSPVPARQTGQPVLVQVFSPEGPPVGGAWIDARSPMPDWVAFPTVSCADDVAIESLVQDVEAAEAAFAALDVDGFEAALQRIASGLPCVDQALRPTQAAAIHRLEGLRLYTSGSRLGALRSFQEAQLLDPAFVPPEALTREGSTLGDLWTRAGSVGSPPWQPVDVPEGVVLRIDGIASSARPATLPGIVQLLTPTGRHLWTRYVPAEAPLPDLAGLGLAAGEDAESQLPPALALYRQDERKRSRSNLRRGLQMGGAALLVGSGLMYGLNARHVADYRDPTEPPEGLASARIAANRAATASAGLLVLGSVSIGASFVF
ncbi:MAG: hypothetical protein R3F61_12830 [Myxococcota bacterium]